MSMFGNLFGKNLDLGKINDRYMGMRPEGWLTPEDRAEAERRRGRNTESLGRYYDDERTGLIRRMGARGMAGSPAAEALTTRLSGKQGEGVLRAGADADSYLAGLKMNREGFERSKVMQAWGNDIGAAMKNYEAENERGAAFWNQLGQGVKGLGSMYGNAGKSSATSPLELEGIADIIGSSPAFGL